jgi:hypothetical protein
MPRLGEKPEAHAEKSSPLFGIQGPAVPTRCQFMGRTGCGAIARAMLKAPQRLGMFQRNFDRGG